ncbi:SGNH hydrolase [Whalleya microplaca]|nr:SGNH hydrolase [Whalleya microplaca]
MPGAWRKLRTASSAFLDTLIHPRHRQTDKPLHKTKHKGKSTDRRAKTTTMAKKPLRILCFGDSLTAGYPAGNPYAERLRERLAAAFPGYEIECEVDGVPGDLVTRGSFVERMQWYWKQANVQEPYDWTIVLGGTNDIGWGHQPRPILEALERTWEIPLSRRGKVLALTIPDTKARNGDVGKRRDALNAAIKGYKKPNFYTYDLYTAVPYHDMIPADRPKYWEMDGVHLTAAGYDLAGEKVAEGLARIMRLAEAQDTEISSVVTDARQRRAIEQLIFEEERGDPRLLSQGYIVVRKADLD